MKEEEVKAEIRSVFATPMKNNYQFPFTFLQCNGGGSKTLTAPQTSTHFQWTADQVVSLAGQGSIYILANEDMDIPVSVKLYVMKSFLTLVQKLHGGSKSVYGDQRYITYM